MRIEQAPVWVLAVLDAPDGVLSEHDRDVLGGARRLAGDEGGVMAVAFADVADAGAAGADRLVRVDASAATARAAAAVELVSRHEPRHVLFADSAEGGHVGRLAAAVLGDAPLGAVREVAPGCVIASGEGGGRDLVFEAPPRVLLIAPEGAEPYEGAPREARAVEPPRVSPDPRVRDLGPLPVDPETLPLDEADFILSAGAGVTDWPVFHRLARALGAAEGGSRVVCDAGHLPRERQVGASGTLVGARCYIALGISGAPQHLQGITRCAHVVAVNADPHAEIMKRAELALVGDVQAIMRAMLAELGERGDD